LLGETLQGVLALLAGVALVGAALRERHVPPRPEPETGRGGALLAGLSRVGPAAALSMAGFLGFGGPKRLVLTFLAMASVSEAGLGDVEDFTLLALYVAVATVLVSVPVGIVAVAGSSSS
jgi:hypothetical protein